MLPTLPPEILDFIVSHLRGEKATLRKCCLVSKSWIPRTRRFLFASICFDLNGESVKSWMKAFPDPSNSPAHHVYNLWIWDDGAIAATNAEARPWIRSFDRVQHLTVGAPGWEDTRTVSLVQLHGISPTLRALHLSYSFIPPSEVLSMVCSFPLLEDLSLHPELTGGSIDGWDVPMSSPKLTGCLSLRDEIRGVGRGLLDLPAGLHFTKIMTWCPAGNAELIMELVSRCSHTLESLYVDFCLSGASRTPPPLDLSGVTRLKSVEFRFGNPRVQWIATSLQTARPETLREITIFSYATFNVIQQAEHIEWQELDHLLVRLWTTYSILPKIRYERKGEGSDLAAFASRLLPGLTKAGISCEVGPFWQ